MISKRRKFVLTKWDKISIVVAMIGLIVGLSSTVFSEPIVINFELNEVSKVDIENNFFKTDQGVIINNFRNTVIYPNDKLTYKTILINKHETPVEYTAFIILRQGGKQVFDPIQLETRNMTGYNYWTTYQREFFVGDEGVKELEIQIQGHDPDSGEMVTSKNFVKNIEVLSLSEKLQSDQNNLTFWGLLASSVIGVGTLAALYFSQKTANKEIGKLDEQNDHLKTQNELLRKQSDNQNNLARMDLNTTTLFKVFELLSSPEIRKARNMLYDEYWKFIDDKKIANLDNAKDEIKHQVDQVLSSFDQVSGLVLNGLLDKEIFFGLYGELIVRDWNALSETIKSRQKDNPKTLYHFTTLAAEFDQRITNKSRVQPYRRSKSLE